MPCNWLAAKQLKIQHYSLQFSLWGRCIESWLSRVVFVSIPLSERNTESEHLSTFFFFYVFCWIWGLHFGFFEGLSLSLIISKFCHNIRDQLSHLVFNKKSELLIHIIFFHEQLMCNYYTLRQDGSRAFMRRWNFQVSHATSTHKSSIYFISRANATH